VPEIPAKRVGGSRNSVRSYIVFHLSHLTSYYSCNLISIVVFMQLTSSHENSARIARLILTVVRQTILFQCTIYIYIYMYIYIYISHNYITSFVIKITCKRWDIATIIIRDSICSLHVNYLMWINDIIYI